MYLLCVYMNGCMSSAACVLTSVDNLQELFLSFHQVGSGGGGSKSGCEAWEQRSVPSESPCQPLGEQIFQMFLWYESLLRGLICKSFLLVCVLYLIPCVSFGVFLVLALKFRLLIHLELIFTNGMR